VDNLRREHIRLSQMQDIAGVRVVGELSLAEQDALVAAISAAFEGAKVVDRREKPSHGYRAMHVIVVIDARNVEIQVRTELQHLWAQYFELLADRFGRGIRYGQPPDNPDLIIAGEYTMSYLVETLLNSSSTIARVEETDHPAREAWRDELRKGVALFSMGESEA
jgi:ppGpp synthetase/RelA/SpoT-type nucleotidyltranferase